MDNRFERLVRWYLRLNGYFTIENFIVHAGDDLGRISQNGVVGNYTETDIIGIRMPYSHEISGALHIANHGPLVNGSERKHDIVIAEAKSGNSNSPNSMWTKDVSEPIEYLVRFIGLYPNAAQIGEAAKGLLIDHHYEDELNRFRYIIFAEKVNRYWKLKGVSYITYSEIIEYLVDIRGESWLSAGIGVASSHQQWEPLINDIFGIANDLSRSRDERVRMVKALLTSAT